MWTDADLMRWRDELQTARALEYREARALLLNLRDELGAALVTEARKQKRARYLTKRAEKRQRRAERVDGGT